MFISEVLLKLTPCYRFVPTLFTLIMNPKWIIRCFLNLLHSLNLSPHISHPKLSVVSCFYKFPNCLEKIISKQFLSMNPQWFMFISEVLLKMTLKLKIVLTCFSYFHLTTFSPEETWGAPVSILCSCMSHHSKSSEWLQESC